MNNPELPELLSDKLMDFLGLCARFDLEITRFATYAIATEPSNLRGEKRERLTYLKLKQSSERATAKFLHFLHELSAEEARAAEQECMRMQYYKSQHRLEKYRDDLREISGLEACTILHNQP